MPVKPKVVQKRIQVQPKKKPPKRPRVSTGLMSALGSAAGGYLGGPAGSLMGGMAGKLISEITGWGAYNVNRNSLVNGNTVPSFRQSSEGVVIAHREFIADVQGSVLFSLLSLPINPGLPDSFPWLSTVAQNFETYDMLGLVFEYRPSSGSAVSAASAALGVVVYATDYNVLSPVFQNKQVMESYEYSCSTVPFEGMLHPVECAPNSNPLQTMYVRTGAVPPNSDARMFDLGLFQFATQGMQSVYTVGELWVSYHVALKKPRIQPDTNSEFAHIVSKATATATAAAPLGTTGGLLSTRSNLLGIYPSLTAPTTSFVMSLPGKYLLSAAWAGLTITAVPAYTRGANISLGDAIFFNSTTSATNSFTAVRANSMNVFSVDVAGTGAANTVVISGLTTMTAGDGDLMFTALPTLYN
jgi:hypothetical protein